MKMKEWRRPHGSTKLGGLSMVPEWDSLPPELVQAVADRVLSTTGGVDAYMDMRAVCSTWRSAVAKPSPFAAVAGLRFRPRHWVMLDLQPDDLNDEARLFLHVPTGRFRRLHLPALRDNLVAGATDGLLVLADMYPPHLARVLNPFTGDMLHFPAALPRHFTFTSVMKGGSHPTLVLLRWGSVCCAAPNSDLFTQTEEAVESYLVSIANFRGDVYCADGRGCVFKLVALAPAADQCDDDDDDDDLLVIPAASPPDVHVYTQEEEGDDHSEMPSYLVESAGELLLVRSVDQTLKVFRVNVEHKLLEEVKSLGGRTLFLGQERCVSVDAAKLPSVEGDCIYMLDFENAPMSDSESVSMSDSEDTSMSDSRDKMCVYNLRGDVVDIISSKDFCARPFSLVQLLLRYCDVLPKL